MPRINRPVRPVKTELFTGTVTRVERMRNTPNGNPRYRLTIAVGGPASAPMMLHTQPDAGWVYGVVWERLEGKAILYTVAQRRGVPVINTLRIKNDD